MVESPELRSQVAREGREGWVEEESAVCSLAPSSERFPPQSLMPALPSAPAAPPDPPPRPRPHPSLALLLAGPSPRAPLTRGQTPLGYGWGAGPFGTRLRRAGLHIGGKGEQTGPRAGVPSLVEGV